MEGCAGATLLALSCVMPTEAVLANQELPLGVSREHSSNERIQKLLGRTSRQLNAL